MNINSQVSHWGVKNDRNNIALPLVPNGCPLLGNGGAELKISIYERICVMGG